MANTDLSSATIGQASINVHDVDQAVAVYRDTLGLRFLFQARKWLSSIAAACG